MTGYGWVVRAFRGRETDAGNSYPPPLKRWATRSRLVPHARNGWGARAVCAALVITAAGGVVRAERRSRVTERIEPGLFHLRSVDLFLEIEANVEQHRVRSKDGSGRENARQTNRRSFTHELIGLDIAGDIVHPYLFDFSGSFAVGYTESRFREETLAFTDSDRASGLLHEFDLRGELFKTKPLSGTIYGTRRDDRIGRLFLPSLREVRTEWGTSWVFKHDVFPMHLDFSRLDTDRTGNRRNIDDERIREDRLRLGGEWKISDHHKFTYEYEHARTQQEFQGSQFDFDTTRDQVRVEHDLEFGPEYQHRLFTIFRYQEETGDLAEDIFEIRPELTLQHTPDLSTRYSYDFRRERYDALEVELHRADFQVRHQFLKNLTTVFNLFGLEERTDDDVETTQIGGAIDWHYTRSNPYGQLTSELGLAFDSERTRGDNGPRAVRNESGTFRDPLPLFLTKPNVMPTSILVTDLTGRIIYRVGTDYYTVRAGDRTAIYRIVNGRIVNGQTVSIDYRVKTPAKGRIDTMRVDFGIQQAFNWGFTPYYRFNYRNQEIEASRGFAFIADRTDHHRLGFTYAKPKWDIHGEYEVFDDAIDPYDAFRLGGSVVVIRTDKQLFDVRLDFSQYFFEGGFEDREVSEINLGARHEYRINQRWTSTLNTTWRWEENSVHGTTNALDVEGVLAYTRGNLSVEFTLEYDLLRIAGSREDSVGAWVALRWDFENLMQLN